MDIASFAIGVIGLFLAIITMYKTRKNELTVRVNLAKLSVKAQSIEGYAGWAVDHYWTVRQCIDSSEWPGDARLQASNAVQRGAGDAMAAARMAHELLRDIRSLQLSAFGRAEDLKSNGKLVLLSSIDVEREGSGSELRRPGILRKK